jgi:hypothetical protein
VQLSKNVVDPEPLIKRVVAEAAVVRAEEERKAAEKAAKEAARAAKSAAAPVASPASAGATPGADAEVAS